ncbi:nucleoside triphosphate pyrophosphatase [candidate division KSB1 bacterium]
MKQLFLHDVKLILASLSPRRKEILDNLGVKYEVFIRNSEEKAVDLKDPGDYVIALAEQKSKEPVNNISEGIVITADTIVYINGNILEKPVDKEDAYRMIKMLQGNTHQVYTGVCLYNCDTGKRMTDFAVSDVTFSEMSDGEIDWYIGTEEYPDKAGAYAIQGNASLFISGINGCFYNVVGFPVNTFYRLLNQITKR